MNARCQPQRKVIQGTTSGVTSAPTFVPELKMPVARARSFLGNHSATVLIEAGKAPDSPRPSAKRASAKPDRKSTRLNSSHRCTSYAVICLEKKKTVVIRFGTVAAKGVS